MAHDLVPPAARAYSLLALGLLLPSFVAAAPLPPQTTAPRSLVASKGLVTAGEGGNAGWGRRVGALPDTFTGVLTHRIALELPPGRRDVAPALALTYSSAGGNGWLGIGWSLPIGRIERSTKRGVSYAADEFVLDLGTPVELVSVGAAEYRAKIESAFHRVRKLVASDGRTSWEVTDRKGNRLLFGQSAASRQDNPADGAQIFAWCLDRFEDPSGNSYSVSYFKSDGEIYPELVSYTGGTRSPTTTVRFWRDAGTRPDSAVLYTPNFGVRTTYRLRAIEVRTNGAVDRLYAFEYEASAATALSRLVSVQQIGADGTVNAGTGVATGSALPATTFAYTTGSAPSSTSFPGPAVKMGASLLNQVNPDLARLLYGDFNGDGRTDLAFVDGSSSTQPIKIFIANAAGFEPPVNGPSRWIGSGVSAVLNDVARVKLGDFNGDGRTDLLCLDTTTSTPVAVYLADGAGAFPAQPSFRGPAVLVGAPDVDVSRLQLADFDGDARTDLLYVPGTGTLAAPIEVYLSTGAGFASRLLGPQFAVGTGAAGVAALARLKLGDFNGDHRTDIAFVNGSGQTLPITIYTLSATGTTFSFLMNGPARFVRADVEGARVDASRVTGADINGDGKTDLLALEGWSTSAPMSVYLATGAGFAAPFSGPTRYFDGLYPDQSLNRLRQGDFNGDGRTDLAFVEGTSGFAAMSIHLSEGARFASAIAGPLRWVAGGAALAQELLRVQVGDFDGDGRADVSGNESSGALAPMTIYPAGGEYPDLLANVSNGIGGSSNISYLASPSWPGTQSPIPLQTVRTFSTDDGNGAVGTTSWAYSGGYYHLAEREFRGFHRVDVTGPAGPSGERAETRYWFHQGNDAAVDANDPRGGVGCTKGKPYRVQSWDLQASSYVETLTAYWPATATPCFTPPQEVTTRHCEQGASGPSCGRSRTVSFAGFSSGQLTFGYDAYGNPLRENDYGDAATPLDDRTTVRTYSANTTRWIVSLPARETTYAGAGPATSLAPDNRISETTFAYDGNLSSATCASTGASATPSRGLLTKVARWLNGGTDPEEWIGHDAYGNEVCRSDPDRRVTRFGYDASATFPTSETNAKGHVTTVQRYGVDGSPQDRGRYGQLKRLVDANGMETTFEYDTFGRRTRETRPPVAAPLAGDPYAGLTVATSYFLGGVETNRVETLTSEGVWTADHFDGLGRTYLARRKGSGAVTARTFNARTVFNATGTQARISQPYFDGVAPRWIDHAFDARGRVRATTQPDGTRVLACFRDLDGSAAEVDANGHRRRMVHDARGNVVAVQEYLDALSSCTADEGSPYATTRYAYDRLDRLTTITDAAGTPYAVGYDTLGRVRFESDPDLGTWYYAYSAAGDQTSIQDANGAAAVPPYAFSQTFDELHRITSRTYPTGAGLAWTYDDPAVPYSRGRLSRVTDASGWTTFGFDAVGRTFTRTQSIDGSAYTTVTRYDAANRVIGEVYPDAASTIATYEFDADGFLGKVVVGGVEYAALAGYNALGQLGRITSPAAVTAYGYDESGNNRLKSVQVTARGVTVLGLAFQYDPARQVKKVTDTVDATFTFEYDYDGLNRLTASRSAAYGALGYSYDRLGNLLTKEGVTYTAYDPIKVHAVKATSDGRTYSYDANGNLLSDGARVLQYDHENRPTSISAGATTTLVTYASDGKRVKRQVRTGPSTITTVYVGRLLECTNGACTRHVFAGDKRIASIDPSGATRYYHVDHLDTTRATTDGAGFVGERIAYKPFGDGDGPASGATRYRYTAKELDRETGLYYYGARYYDPVLGRFITPDPIAPPPHDPQSLNRYAYTRNNPASNRDPTGHAVETPWDAANVVMGVASFAANIGAGNWGAAAVDALGIIADTAATAAPGVPGGAASVIRAARLADKGLDVLKAADRAGDAARAADRAADAARAADGAAEAARAAEKAADAANAADKAADAARAADDAGAAAGVERTVTVSRSRHPQSAAHIEDAQAAGQPATLTIDRSGAAARRRDSLRGTERRPGLDRDEYPPARFKEGGSGSSTRHIDPPDNRGSGACVGGQCRDLPDGARVRLEVGD